LAQEKWAICELARTFREILGKIPACLSQLVGHFELMEVYNNHKHHNEAQGPSPSQARQKWSHTVLLRFLVQPPVLWPGPILPKEVEDNPQDLPVIVRQLRLKITIVHATREAT
jgi:hypothetical protein